MKKNKVQAVLFYAAPSNKKYFLLLKMNKKRGFFWQNITGGVENDEDFEAAALREAQEETAIKSENIKRIIKSDLEFKFHDQWGKDVTEKVFFIEAVQKWDVTIDPNEHSDFAWVHEDDITKDSVHYPSNYQCLNEVIATL